MHSISSGWTASSAQPRHLLREQIGLGLNVGDVMLCREPTNIGCGRLLGHSFSAFGAWLILAENIAFVPLKNPLNREQF